MKIAICVPHYGPLPARFVASLTALLAACIEIEVTYNGEVVRPRIATLFEESGPLEYKRSRLVKRSLAGGADYIQWIDTDQTFPTDAMFRLMRHDLPIVGCNYPRRGKDERSTAFALDESPLISTPEKGAEPEAVGALGFGFCLMKAPIFDFIPQPWFATTMGTDGEVSVGEDVHFCNRARAAGIPVHVDHALSLEIGHIGETVKSFGD